MMRLFSNFIRLLLCLSFVIALLYPGVASAAQCEKWVARVVSVQGAVEVKRVGETQWQPVKLNDTYCPGDEIRAGENSRANLALINQAVLRLNQNTSMTLGEFKEERTSLVDLFKGAAHFFSRKPRSLEVKTPFAIAGVRGTEFFIEVQEDQTFLSVFEGQVLAANEAGSLTLSSGQSAVAEAGRAPALRVVVRPRDAVQWALYYPAVIYRPEEVREDTRDPRFLVSRASQLLAVGRVDEARADIERALRLEPKYSNALALQAIIAVVQNDREKALRFANQAVEADPGSATALIALSYAQQARFDLEGARKSLEKAVKVDPENALAWARLAELWASFGNLSRSLKAAQKAVALDPNLSRTQTVLGFAYLTQVKIKESNDAFNKAIRFDQADPLPRLGLGLAIIRDGKLDEGARQIEIAASLDPNNSLIRSYLGKTYYEEKRTDLDGAEYKIAKELDPNDPTPYFYDAIRKQTINRPVEALRDLQKSIELNNNRAVFRSKLQLDSDLAARSSSLARIYNNLGFQQRGLVEGWDSLNTDPSNFSAHRFLSDTYSSLPRHEIARVSELLQSQLLQPINITPIQPRLAESNLFLISSQGPAGIGFNEFNPLFNRNQVAVQASGIVGGNDTYGGEGILSGIYQRLSFSVGGTYFKTDGWRTNADQKDRLADFFVQAELSYKTSIQAEFRHRKTDSGDLVLRFFDDEGDFRPNEDRDEKRQTFRLGLRHAFTPGSIIIGNFSVSGFNGTLDDKNVNPVLASVSIETDENAVGGELQYLFRSEPVNVVVGGGYFDVDSQDKTLAALNLPPFPIGPPGPRPVIVPDSFDRDVNHTNLYLYSYINLLKDVTFTAGASGDFFDTDDDALKDEDQFNPKVGITWYAPTGTTVRAAAFRVLKRTLIAEQTLEPTQVAGFNQFFDDANGTKAWRYGAAIDQKFPKDIYFGGEFSKRDLKVQYVNPITSNVDETDWDEWLGRAYLFWTPHNWLSLTAEYLYEKFKRDEDFTAGFKDLKTHSVPLGINFFHPSGFNASVKGTYYYQDGKFQQDPPPPGVFVSADDHFWLLDASISYRLPKRYGFITLGVSNLTDEDFNFEDTDVNNPHIQPDRVFFGRVTLALP